MLGVRKNKMSLLESIKAFFESWEKIDSPPKWVLKAYSKWEGKLPTHPYNMTKHFVGKTFVYKVRHGMERQGEAPIIGWYKKLKKKENEKEKIFHSKK